MKKRDLICNVVNIILVMLIWSAFAAAPMLFDKKLPILLWVGWVVVTLPTAGYLVQYVFSKWVNAVFYKNVKSDRAADNCHKP